jgi:MGT family glycosyltransferase
MSRYVFLNLPAFGHISPTLPIVQELSARGDTVIYYLPERFREIIEAAGARFKTYPLETLFFGKFSGANTTPGDDRLRVLPFLMAKQSKQIVPRLAESIKAERPDCLVYNAMHLWARLGARILGIRAVGFRPYHAPKEPRSVVAPFATKRLAALAVDADRELDSLAHVFGLPSITLDALVSASEELTLVFMPREFQYKGDAFDERFLFVGPSLRASGAEQRFFAERSTDTPIRVYVSLGTLRNNEPEFYRMCFCAFDPDEWQAVMSVGNKIDIVSLSPFPENFVVEPSVPQLELLPNVDVFVSHGGLNSTMESLFFGVPLVVIPSIREQRLTGRRIQELGLGIVLDHENLTPETLRETVRKIARDPEIRARVKRMQHIVRSSGGSHRAVEAIVKFANGR